MHWCFTILLVVRDMCHLWNHLRHSVSNENLFSFLFRYTHRHIGTCGTLWIIVMKHSICSNICWIRPEFFTRLFLMSGIHQIFLLRVVMSVRKTILFFSFAYTFKMFWVSEIGNRNTLYNTGNFLFSIGVSVTSEMSSSFLREIFFS